jgi:hypothetical protein
VRSGETSFAIRRPKAEQLEFGTEIFVHLPPSTCIAFGAGAEKAAKEQEDAAL